MTKCIKFTYSEGTEIIPVSSLLDEASKSKKQYTKPFSELDKEEIENFFKESFDGLIPSGANIITDAIDFTVKQEHIKDSYVENHKIFNSVKEITEDNILDILTNSDTGSDKFAFGVDLVGEDTYNITSYSNVTNTYATEETQVELIECPEDLPTHDDF